MTRTYLKLLFFFKQKAFKWNFFLFIVLPCHSLCHDVKCHYLLLRNTIEEFAKRRERKKKKHKLFWRGQPLLFLASFNELIQWLITIIKSGLYLDFKNIDLLLLMPFHLINLSRHSLRLHCFLECFED